ncbi:M48 family metallopeptidase [Paraneptunicella aestuarii]|uniref:beta-barrel assembly-enhancing protease n=1 Tax=Paraneptunicella aestuarii TaxID=2831148 RepID=UPI001E5F0B3D|nr:M48 family metalloprotease [Paraneptunicella aestuarii]UAA40339.1 M48 family metallopeptidase [Paraneptunicella aestuarii]
MKQTFFFLLSCFLSFSSLAQTQHINSQKNALPSIGVVASEAISIEKEQLIGDALMRQLRAQAPIIMDPVLEEYLNDLGNRLVIQAEDVKFPFNFFWLNNKDINAFAFFGGNVGVHTGLMLAADNESELASVLAHEISHVTQRHVARTIAARQKSSPLQVASLIGGLILAAVNPEAGIAAISATNAASQQFSINYTRSNEQEADRVGFQIMRKSGFDTNASATFFGKLAAKERSRSKAPAFLMTHPRPESRVADARNRQLLSQANSIAPSLAFHLAKARVIARYSGDEKYNIQFFQNQIEKQEYVFEEAAKYGLAMSYLNNNQSDEAEALINELLAQDPENLFYLDVVTDIYLAQGQSQKAVSKLEVLAKKMPRNRVITLNLANAAIKQGKYQYATNIIKDYLLINPEHTLSYQLLIESYGSNNQMLEMHQTRAEWFSLMGAYPNAIDELHSAYNYAKDNHLEKQRIRARIEQFREAQEQVQKL